MYKTIFRTLPFNTKKEAKNRLKLIKETYKNGIIKKITTGWVVVFEI